MNRDIAITPTTSWATIKSLSDADTDHNDIGTELSDVTVTNETDKTVYIKGTAKSSVSGTGRSLAVGASFNYLTLDLDNSFIKASGAVTGKVIITGYNK